MSTALIKRGSRGCLLKRLQPPNVPALQHLGPSCDLEAGWVTKPDGGLSPSGPGSGTKED